jgi:hypothetical protein
MTSKFTLKYFIQYFICSIEKTGARQYYVSNKARACSCLVWFVYLFAFVFVCLFEGVSLLLQISTLIVLVLQSTNTQMQSTHLFLRDSSIYLHFQRVSSVLLSTFGLKYLVTYFDSFSKLLIFIQIFKVLQAKFNRE